MQELGEIAATKKAEVGNNALTNSVCENSKMARK